MTTKRAFAFIATLLIAAVMSALAQSTVQRDKVHVEIIPDKKQYKAGEIITYRVVLINESSSAVYVSKLFASPACTPGISGFNVSAEQLSGRKRLACGCGGSSLPPRKSPPDQILREDFIELYPNDIIGLKSAFQGCNIHFAGLYKIAATYEAADSSIPDLLSLKEGPLILTGKIESKPVTIRVVQKPKK